MKNYKFYTLVIFLAILNLMLFSEGKATPQLRFIGDTGVSPAMYVKSVDGSANEIFNSLFWGARIKQFTFGGEISDDYFSAMSADQTYNAAFNILRGSFNFFYEPVKYFELKVGLGGGYLATNLYKLTLEDKSGLHDGGLSILLDTFIRTPWPYFQLKLINRLDIFFNSSPYYYGAFQYDFHPFVEWINLYLETGWRYWYYSDTSEYQINDAIFVFKLGLSVDMTFPLTIPKVEPKKPVVKAGKDQEVLSSNVVNLKGSVFELHNLPVTYQWKQISGNEVVLDNSTDLSTSFTAPENKSSVDLKLTFALTAINSANLSATDKIVIIVKHKPEEPIVDAGEDQIVESSEIISLSGAVSDINNLDLSYKWTQIKGKKVELKDDTSLTPSFEVQENKTGADTALIFKLTATNSDRLSRSDTVSIILRHIPEIERDLKLAVQDITFYPESKEIRETSYKAVDTIYKVLIENPEIKIILEGHTNPTGNPNNELLLSKQRTESVKNYLVKKGIAQSRIKAVGYGGTRPKFKGVNQKNRRVEIIIIQE